jgi:hypothetical protein
MPPASLTHGVRSPYRKHRRAWGGLSLGYRAELFTMRADMRYSAGGSPYTARNALLKSPGLEKPHRAAMAATGREACPGSESSWRQRSKRRRRIHPTRLARELDVRGRGTPESRRHALRCQIPQARGGPEPDGGQLPEPAS